MDSLPSAEPSASNAIETIVRLTLSQNQRDLPNNNQTQAIPNTSIITNNNICNTSKQHGIVTQSVRHYPATIQHDNPGIKKKFTNKVSGDITKIMQAYTTVQENTGKFIENTISQMLTKAQNTTISPTSVDARNVGVNYTNSSYETNWTTALTTSNLAMLQQPENEPH